MHMTKQTLLVLAVTLGALNLQPLVQSAESNAPALPRAAVPPGPLQERIQSGIRDLNLTIEQKDKLQAVIRAHLEKLRAFREDTSLSQEQKLAKLKALREEINAEAGKLLTPEQLKSWRAKQGQGTTPAPGPMTRIQETIKGLNLSEDQKAQLKPLYEEQMARLRELHQDKALSPTQKLDKLVAMQNELAPKVKKVMSMEQFSKWEKEGNQWTEQLRKRIDGTKAGGASPGPGK